jgi:ABC-type sugar transport system ATPase subunit
MSAVALRGLAKRFDRRTEALKAISLEVASREFLVLLGPSGCGKTTVLRLIAGLEAPSAGDILIDGIRVNDLPPKDRDVAMVFQNYALYPHLSVRENIAFPLRMRRLPREQIEARVVDVGAMLGLSDLLDRRPAQLSGGERQRVALGRAVVRRPKVFLFDEPLSNLDAKLRVQMRAELVRLHRTLGATMIYVTHDQVEAMTMGERIAVLSRGEVQQVGAPADIYAHPANTFVAGFIGNPGMNLIPQPDGEAGRIVGFRPEDAALGATAGATCAGTVSLIEPLGSETLVHVRLDAGETVVCRSRGAPVPGVNLTDRVGVRVAADRLHRFDAATGCRLT